MSKFQIFLIVLYLFFFGAVGGWVLELLFRRFFSGANPERKWLNPGFLFGPCLPLYGFGTVLLFILSELDHQLFGSLYVPPEIITVLSSAELVVDLPP